jgi:hypothetical protein
MSHKFTVPYQGESSRVLKTAQKMMAERGFKVSAIGGGKVSGSRNHSLTTGKKTNDMIALVSELVITATSGHVSAEVDLGTFRKLVIFLITTFVALESAFLIVGLVLAEDMLVVKISSMTLAPWLVLGPGMLYFFRRKALQEIETLLDNVATIGTEN